MAFLWSFPTSEIREVVSDAAKAVGLLFARDEVGETFFKTVIDGFRNLDDYHSSTKNKTLLVDIDHIMKATTADIKSKNRMKRSSERIDVYFYIHRRCKEYAVLLSNRMGIDRWLQDFENILFLLLRISFEESLGEKPNLTVKDISVLYRMNIPGYLSSIRTIDDYAQLLKYFVLMKLSIQSAAYVNGQWQYVQWIYTLKSIASIKFSLEEFVQYYLKYKAAFSSFPWDTKVLIYLIEKLYSPRIVSKPPIRMFIALHDQIDPNNELFFEQFLPLFRSGMEKETFKARDIVDTLSLVKAYEQLIRPYFDTLTNRASPSLIFDTMLLLCDLNTINSDLEKHFSQSLSDKISRMRLPDLLRWIDLAKTSIKTIKEESRGPLLRAIDKVFDRFVLVKLPSVFSNPFHSNEYVDLFNKWFEFVGDQYYDKVSFKNLIYRIVVGNENYNRNTPDKLKSLFQNIRLLPEAFSRQCDPEKIIDDSWLKDFIISNAAVWLKIDRTTYHHLCSTHQQNRWIIYVWSRIMHLSLINLSNTSTPDVLIKLNDWMKTIDHENYDFGNTLTTIFVRSLFDTILIKYSTSILTLPSIDAIIKFLIGLRPDILQTDPTHAISVFFNNGMEILKELVQLKSKCSWYPELATGSIISSFLPLIDIRAVMASIDIQDYKFPKINHTIGGIMSLGRPRDLDTIDIQTNEIFFKNFIQEVNRWLQWFIQNLHTFRPIITWMNLYNVNGMNQLLGDIGKTVDDPKTSIIDLKKLVERVLRVLHELKDLRRLCFLFSCLTSFHIVDSGSLDIQDNAQSFISELKRFQKNNSYTVEDRKQHEQIINIRERQKVQWSLASEKYDCSVIVEFRINGANTEHQILYHKENIPIYRKTVHGEFETQLSGQLFITIDNSRSTNTKMIWYRIKSTDLTVCYLFDGIFKMHFKNFYSDNDSISANDFSGLIEQVFEFIGHLLDGDLSLREMTQMRIVFSDNNINIREEVKKLVTSRTTEQRIDAQDGMPRTTNQDADIHVSEQNVERICTWLQIYQYYSHVNIVLDCIEKFDILSDDTEDVTVAELRKLTGNENTSLRQISQAYQILQEKFQSLSHQHLQLIKTVIDCSAVVQMMKTADLYSDSGRRRFQELRDNLTTQFQMQERNNMILNSWILCYNLIEPFVSKAANFDIFIIRLALLRNLDGNMLDHIRVVNDNMQLVTMWLTADQTTVLDNALITMINLYKTGKVSIHLRYLLNQPSCYEISYSIGRANSPMINENDARQNENLPDSDMHKIDLSTTEIHDHRRQLTFCKADEEQNFAVQRSLVNGQLHLLDTIDEIFVTLQNLESAGHPDFQLRDEKYGIHLQQVEWNFNLTDLRNYQAARLDQAIKDRTENLKQIVVAMKKTHSMWINDLDKYRNEYPLLKLYTNREIMILILLLRSSREANSVRDRFLKKIFTLEKSNNEQVGCENLAIRMLCHYLRSLRVSQADLNVARLTTLYRAHQITIESNTETSLQKLIEFLDKIFPNVESLLGNNIDHHHSQQYVVKLNPSRLIHNRSEMAEQRFDRDTCCVMLNLFQDQLPAFYQILWCSNTTKEEIELFFSRIRTFLSLIFIVMDVDRMHHRLREVLLNEQDKLASEKSHGTVYYFSNELTITRRGLREFFIPTTHREPEAAHRYLMKLFENQKIIPSPVKIIYGEAGIGKTHRTRNLNMQDKRVFCFSINDQLSVSLMVSSFLSFESGFVSGATSLFYNISMHAPFEVLNRMFFTLFICGCVNDSSSGLMFSLPSNEHPWDFIVEVPHSGDQNVELKENFVQKLPVLAVFSPFTLEEVTGSNHPLVIGDQEKVVAKFLKAFNDRSIDRKLVRLSNRTEQPVTFPDLSDADECRRIITDCIKAHVPELPMSKIFQVSFVKFLYRRVKFFEGNFFSWNETKDNLGSIAMEQMLKEVNSLIRINFDKNNFPRIFLVYDPGFSLHLLHTDWNHVDRNLRALFENKDPWTSSEYKDKDYFAECLAWLMNIDYKQFIAVMKDTKFILTENFTYKLFHIHERKLTRLPLIIEGGTGVGKTFLLRFYSLLLSYKRTYDSSEKVITPQILENMSTFLGTIITTIVETNEDFLRPFLQCIKSKLVQWTENNSTYYNNNSVIPSLLAPDNNEEDVQDAAIDLNLLTQIKTSLQKNQFGKNVLYQIWRTIVGIAYRKVMVNVLKDLIERMQNHIVKQVTENPLIQTSGLLDEPQQDPSSPNAEAAIEYFRHYLFFSRIKPLFYRLLIHPGITEYQLTEFMTPIMDLARQLPETDIVVFFDEVNTASCLGLFKEIFIDKSLNGRKMPENIFFTAAINPWTDPKSNDANKIHRTDFIVHQLPKSLEDLTVKYGTLESKALADYIVKKISMFRMTSSFNNGQQLPLDDYCQGVLADAILKAQEFCEKRLGINSVSQREIQRCFNLIEFFWNLRYEDELCYDRSQYSPNPLRCIVLSIALIYYFRLPTRADNQQRKDEKTPSREDLAELLDAVIMDFTQVVENELERFVNKNNFDIPPGVAINQAVREHIFAIVVSLVTRTPLCIIGVPGQSKTLSFQIVLQNLQGAQLSPKAFCKRLPAIDPFFCLGSKYTTSDDVAAVFDRAIKREQQYEQNQMNMRCVVFLDEASLPDEKKMVLKVLHPYLDECKVAFVAVANQSFDAANANRMICIYRSLPSEIDQKVLAYGCLGLQIDPQQDIQDNQRDRIVSGLCHGYRRILVEPDLPHIFHDRDFIYMLRELRFALTQTTETSETAATDVTPLALLRALEHNFNGIRPNEFQSLVKIFASSVAQQCPNFKILLENMQDLQRDIITILRDSMKLDSNRRRLYGRYKLIIDESEDESAIRLLFETGILISDPSRTVIFRMSDFSEDANNDLKNVEILSNIKLCMETGRTIVMINTGRIHGSLYDVFNQNFSIMATHDSRKIFSKVAIGSKTLDVAVHEDFQCIVHVKRSEFKDIPAPFLSRFQKYSLSVDDFYRIQLQKLPLKDREMLEKTERTAQSFVTHFGEEYFLGFNKSTIPSCLLSMINRNEKNECSVVNIAELYTQLTLPSKNFIEENPTDQQQCFLFGVLSKLMQLVTPESVIYRLPTFENQYARAFCNHYFYQQEHLNLEKFLIRLDETPTVEINEQAELLNTTVEQETTENKIAMVRKVILYTRTSAMIMNLHGNSNPELFPNSADADLLNDINSKISIVNIVTIADSATLEKRFNAFMEDRNKLILINIIDARIHQQKAHIPFVRRLIDQADQVATNSIPQTRKYFVILIHAPGQELNRRNCFPSTFLEGWDYYFIDTSSPGNAFHLKKMLQIFTSKTCQTNISMKLDEPLYDLNHLFDDCLWEFCLRLRIRSPELPEHCFKNEHARNFYRHNVTITRRVESLKEIFHQVNELQKHIINLYHEKISMKGDAFRKSCNSIYQICKDTLCGKHLGGLVDVLQSRIKSSFNNFVSAILKNLVDDYGLDNFSKLSESSTGCMKLLELIDYSNLSINDPNESEQTAVEETIIFTDHFSCIPEIPVFFLLRQRLMLVIENVKTKAIQRQLHQDTDEGDIWRDEDPIPSTTEDRFEQHDNNDNNQTVMQRYGNFRTQLINGIKNDRLLKEIITPAMIDLFTHDSIRMECRSVEGNFLSTTSGPDKAIDFLTKWLKQIDAEENTSLTVSSNPDLWRFANIYTLFEYELDDLISLYSACRIMDMLDTSQSHYATLLENEEQSRSKVRGNLFLKMFQSLWTSLRHLDENQKDKTQTWIESYNMVSKYYPSERVLQRREFVSLKDRIEFMNLAYLILLNEKTPKPMVLIDRLLQITKLIEDQIFVQDSICLRSLRGIIEEISKYFQQEQVSDTTLMIDIQQWIIRTLKSSKKSSQTELIALFNFLSQPNPHLSLAVKQFLFDELCSIQMENMRPNLHGVADHRITTTFWDHICLLPTMINSLDDVDLAEYRLPYHPSVITDPNQNQILLDLYFFYLRKLSNENQSRSDVMKKILFAGLPQGVNMRRIGMAEKLLKALKDFFSIELTAKLLCESTENVQDQTKADDIIKAVIDQHLTIDQQATQLSDQLKHFFSIIISKKSWNYLSNLLQSERLQNLNSTWTNTLKSLLLSDQNPQQNSTLQLCHQVQFTMNPHTASFLFPNLHTFYDELKQLVQNATQNQVPDQRWIPLLNWIQPKLNSNPPNPTAVEIKVMLLLNIYYQYYCTNQLKLLDGLLTFINNHLQPVSPEELIVFQAFLEPEKFMIGYTDQPNHADKNLLNDLFHLKFQDIDELPIRHVLVNLLAMILLAGKDSILWPFAFEPLKIKNTYGFASLRPEVVSEAVHYDCGCILTETGTLILPNNIRSPGSFLNVPAVYVAYFATFGAMAWHLLLYNNSIQTLYHPILAKHAVDNQEAGGKMHGGSLRARVCHFVRTRFISTNFFLSQESNQDEACILLNLCFERLAALNRQPQENPWIKPVFKTHAEQYTAEKGFQDQIFYPMTQKVTEVTKLISNTNMRSQIPRNLLDYASQSPIFIDFAHFRKELCNPTYTDMPLIVLRRVMDSFDFLRMTEHIYHLSQFHYLLHRTFSRLIDSDELLTISLQQLFERSRKHMTPSQRFGTPEKHLSIIHKGIEALNEYHKFADGLIRPGACDVTRRFEPISINTPVNYLVDTGVSDEGNIVMRILEVLVDFHNGILNALKEGLKRHDDDPSAPNSLQKMIDELSKKEISIVKVAQESTGVITLNGNDRQWIERVCRASLQNMNDYFLQRNTTLVFDYLYIQSYIIRTYLLYCSINCEYMRGKYQCLIKRKQAITTNELHTNDANMDISFKQEWSHLEQMSLDRLQSESKYLERIQNFIQTVDDQKSLGKMFLSEFIENENYGSAFAEQYEQYGMKDFSLDSIGMVQRLYEKAINNFQQAFTHLSQTLMIPLELEMAKQLDENLADFFLVSPENNEEKTIENQLEKISSFINDLKQNDIAFKEVLSESFPYICECLGYSSECYTLIPDSIKGENYVAVCQKFIDIRSKLYEKKINIREQSNVLWSPYHDEPVADSSVTNDFEAFRQTASDDVTNFSTEEPQSPAITTDPSFVEIFNIIDNIDLPDNFTPAPVPKPNPVKVPSKSIIEYQSEGEIKINLITSQPSLLFQSIHSKIEQMKSITIQPGLTVHLPNKQLEKKFCAHDKFYDKCREIFIAKKIDPKVWGIIDPEHLLINFLPETNTKTRLITSNEYRVIEKSTLILVEIDFENTRIEYSATDQATLSSILSRLILDNQFHFEAPTSYFNVFDQQGKLLVEDSPIKDLYRSKEPAIIHLEMVRCDPNKNHVYELALSKSSGESVAQTFSSTTRWKQVNLWLMDVFKSGNSERTTGFNLWSKDKQMLIEESESISSTVLESTVASFDIITSDAMVDIFLSYDATSIKIRVLKSMPVGDLLQNKQHLDRLNLKVSPDECILVLGEDEKTNLEGDDLSQSVETYLSTGDELLRFQIAILIRINKYADRSDSAEIPLILSNRNYTVGQLLDMIRDKMDGYEYLALTSTKMILTNQMALSHLKLNAFHLVKQSQTCCVSIRQSRPVLVAVDDEVSSQKYITDATIHDVYTQNSSIQADQSIQFEDFIPPRDTRLHTLMMNPSAHLEFAVVTNDAFVNVTITSEEKENPITFQCTPAISFGRIKEIVCRLWRLRNLKLYKLVTDDDFDLDDDLSLSEAVAIIANLQIKLVSSADVKCTIRYLDQECTIPAMNETLGSEIFQQAIQEFLISNDEIESMKLYVLDDPESPSEMDGDITIEYVRGIFPEDTTHIPFQLIKE